MATVIPCQCEHSECTHKHLAVPAGTKHVAMFLGPICDDCASHMQGYLLSGADAARATKEVQDMYDEFDNGSWEQ